MKMQKTILQLFTGGTLALGTSVGACADNVGIATDNPWPEYVQTAEGERSQPINLSEVWTVDEFGYLAVPYSAIGWGVDNEDVREGSRTTLSVQLVNGEGAESVFASNMEGAGCVPLTTWGFRRGVYRLRHLVSVGGQVDESQTLEARFSFENVPSSAPTQKELLDALAAPEGVDFDIVKDEQYRWRPTGGRTDGLAAAADATSRLTLAFYGNGELNFEYSLSSAELHVSVDGNSIELDATDGWSPFAIPVSGAGSHSIVFEATVAGGGSARIRNLSWKGDWMIATSESASVQVDLRSGKIKVVNHRDDLFPFVYSSTNFTGAAGADAESIARVSVVRLTGEGDNPLEWAEDSQTIRVLKEGKGEGTVRWGGKSGVWKVKFEIEGLGGIVHDEWVILDLRKFGKGLVLFLI